MTTAIDPICGMEVDITGPVGTSQYKGETYYFCSKGCKNAFDKAPQNYVGGSHSEEGHAEHEGPEPHSR